MRTEAESNKRAFSESEQKNTRKAKQTIRKAHPDVRNVYLKL